MIIPRDVEDIIDRHSGKAAGKIKREIEKVVVSMPDSVKMAMEPSPSTEEGRTVGNWILDIKGNELRPETELTWEIIDAMEESAMPSFAVLMKLAPILSVFRSWNGILVKSSNADLNEVVMENTRQILPLMAMEFGFRSMIDGVCFMETRWTNTTKFELGIAKNRLPSKLYTVGKHPHIVDPRSVKSIIRNGARREFGGFIQRNYYPPNNEITVSSAQALVIPHNEKFRNLWGTSALQPIYRPWFWYQVLLRSAVRWGERMALPLIIAKGPMQEQLQDPADPTTYILAMDYMRNVASTLSRSTFGVIPSDLYKESSTPKYDIGYESVSDAGVSTALSALIQEFAQMIIRAAISADRATTQASGGVGSYAIGSIHDQATQYHNQLILTRWVNYLNRFYMPWFSYFNLGVNGPPIRLEVATVDPSFRDLLNQMLSTMGNSKPGQEALWSIDYDTFLSLAHLPTLDPDEAKKRKDKYEKEAMDRAEEAMKRQQAAAPPPEAAEARRNQGSAPKSEAAEKADETIKNIADAREEIVGRLRRGEKIPIMASLEQIERWMEVDRKPITLQDPDFDESRVKRDAGGRFAKKESAVAQTAQALSDVAQRILNLLTKFGNTDNARKRLDEFGLSDQELEDALKLMNGSQRYDSLDDAFNSVVDELVEGGFGEREDIERVANVVYRDMSFDMGAIGLWTPGEGRLSINKDFAVLLLSGDPYTKGILAHEILHASASDAPEGFEPKSDFQKDLLAWGWPTEANNFDEYVSFTGNVEGRNELARLIYMNESYGTTALTADSPAALAATIAMFDGSRDDYNKGLAYKTQAYLPEVQTISQLAIIAERNGLTSARDYVVESNKKGNSQIAAEEELRTMFPSRMESYGTREDGTYAFPDMDTISSWASEDYGVERNHRNVEYILGKPLIPSEVEEISKIKRDLPLGGGTGV